MLGIPNTSFLLGQKAHFQVLKGVSFTLGPNELLESLNHHLFGKFGHIIDSFRTVEMTLGEKHVGVLLKWWVFPNKPMGFSY